MEYTERKPLICIVYAILLKDSPNQAAISLPTGACPWVYRTNIICVPKAFESQDQLVVLDSRLTADELSDGYQI